MNNMNIPLSIECNIDLLEYKSDNNYLTISDYIENLIDKIKLKDIEIENIIKKSIQDKSKLCDTCIKRKECKILKKAITEYPLTTSNSFTCYFWESSF